MGLFSKDIKSMDDLFLHTLQDVYYAENQIVKALPKMIDKATNRDLAAGLRTHLRETENQVVGLEQAFERLGQNPKGVDCSASDGLRRMSLRQFVTNRRMLTLMLGTAGTWFLFDYAYYGNTLSLPSILKQVSPHASLETKLAWTLAPGPVATVRTSIAVKYQLSSSGFDAALV